MSDLNDLLTSVFTDKAGHEQVIEAERTPLLGDLWKTVAELGLPWIGVAEESGGSGGSLTDLLALMRASGQYAVPLPILENHLATWAYVQSGGKLESPQQHWSLAQVVEQSPVVELVETTEGGLDKLDHQSTTRFSGTLRDVAWGATAARVVALVGDRLVVLDPASAEIATGRDLAGQPRDRLTFTDAPAEVLDGAVTLEQLRQRAAVLRAAQMAGAMHAVYEVTNTYVYQREQFGRPVGTFQAVRSHLVQLAQMAVTTTVSADRAAAALESGRDASFDAYAAKLVADQNAAVSIKSGHQAHGAIGMTREYHLQDLTRRLNAWRGDWGTEIELADRIGAAVVDARRVATVATDAGSLSV